MNDLQITKASGERVAFDAEKLISSLQRAGATPGHAAAIGQTIEQQLYDGISSREIYRLAHRLLRKKARHTAARYSLKQALLAFGPSGFPFEQFIARLLKAEGYYVQTGLLRQGRCIDHEIDVLAESDGRVIVGECKFHNRQNRVNDVKIPLYINARFHDLKAGFLNSPEWKDRTIEGWVFTNTRFTDDALQYGQCAKMRLVSWSTPGEYGLRDWVDRTGLHPVTCLTSLTRREKDALLEKQVVLVRELLKAPVALTNIGVKQYRIKKVLEEAGQLCG